jgi:hypothetical protein
MCPIRCTLALAVALSAPVAAHAAPPEQPPVGTVQTLPVLSVSIAVGSTGRETKRAVYAPPPGWYVRSHRVASTNRYGMVTYTVSTVPAKWDWKADEQTGSIARSIAAGTASVYKFSGGGQLATLHEANATDHQAFTSSHHMLVFEVEARGGGFLQSGSGAELTVYAEMVYLGK